MVCRGHDGTGCGWVAERATSLFFFPFRFFVIFLKPQMRQIIGNNGLKVGGRWEQSGICLETNIAGATHTGADIDTGRAWTFKYPTHGFGVFPEFFFSFFGFSYLGGWAAGPTGLYEHLASSKTRRNVHVICTVTLDACFIFGQPLL
ncbi:hypothetical protein LY76DRAFT_365901 [Colletotrichum caudatum]|nr:hypothetical protein LY76DRAFT_365901 [Colletotrichum caudatum]